MTTTLITSVTDGQKKQIKRFAEDAVDRAIAEGLFDKEGAQTLIGNGDDWQDHILAGIRKLSVSNQFADEEVESKYGYLSGYRQPKPIGLQVKLLQGTFANIGGANEKLAEQPLPPNTEGYFAIPRWEVLARWQRSPERSNEPPLYEEALVKVFRQISASRNGKFHNYREGALGADRLRLIPKTIKALEKLAKQQEGYDILVVPCQFGFRHRGRSVRRARKVMTRGEFGLDPFSITCMLLTHEERLKHHDDPWIDCAGADYDFVGAGRFDYAPFFVFDGVRVKFDASGLDNPNGHFGSASGVSPQ